jgi:hypothetical protein
MMLFTSGFGVWLFALTATLNFPASIDASALF